MLANPGANIAILVKIRAKIWDITNIFLSFEANLLTFFVSSNGS